MKRIVFYLCIFLLRVGGTIRKPKGSAVRKLMPIEHVGELSVRKLLTIPKVPITAISSSGEIMKLSSKDGTVFRTMWTIKSPTGLIMSTSENEMDSASTRCTKEGIILNDDKNTLNSRSYSNVGIDLQVRANYVTLLHSSNTNVSMQMNKDTCCNNFDNNAFNGFVNFLRNGNKLSANVANEGMLVACYHNAFKTGDTYGSQIIYYNGATIKNYVSYDLDKAESIVNNPKFDTTSTTVLFIHGYNQSPETPHTQTLINAYISNGNYNFMVLDWRAVASGNVVAVMSRVNPLGIEVAHFLEGLNKKGVSLSKVHLVGHSLGAHIAAIAGKYIIQWSGNTKKIDRITGLDPANFYDYNVMYNYARFVDIIHTAAGSFGSRVNMGHVDFWPNNGVARQPGCLSPTFPITLEKLACSHLRAIYYWSESVERKDRVSFLAVNRANPQIQIQMGNNCPTFVKGYYMLTTNSASFYSKN